MAAFDWGDVRLGRIPLRETFTVAETGGNERSLELEGQESYPPLTRAEVLSRHDSINALQEGTPIAVTWSQKPERNGYYAVKSAGSTLTERVGDLVTATWKVSLERLGSEGEVDLQSRLTGAVRLNDFALAGERWHAPPIGHAGYYTGSSNPASMTRTGEDGAITVYRSVPASISPRWGCDPGDYLDGRVRANDTAAASGSGLELDGINRPVPADDWALSNGLVNVTPTASAGIIDVQAYTGGAWHSKPWTISVGGAAVAAWDSATLVRNDCEQCILRLVASRSPGRATLDLALRRGSRIVEGYLQSGSSATLAVHLQTAETNTSFAASGYVTATNDDADGNRFTAGSARTFTAHANGGVSKATVTALDFWLGVVATGSGGGTLNTNPTFETDLTGWTGSGGVLTRSSVVAKVGTWSGRLVPDGVSALAYMQGALTAVTTGTTYRATGWLWCAAARQVDLNVDWFDAAQGYLATSNTNASVGASAWSFLDFSAAAPALAAYGSIVPILGSTPPAGHILHADEVRLRLPVSSGDAATDLRNQYIGALAESTHAVRR